MNPVRILGTALILALVPIQAARACSRFAVPSVRNITTLPLDGTGAPRNTRLWTIAQAGDEGAFTLRDSRGVAAMLARSTISISGEQTLSLEILTPMSLLDPGEWVFSRGGTLLSRFTVLDEVDQTAPDALTPAIATANGEHYGAYSCGRPSLVTITLGTEAVLAIAAQEGQIWEPTTALGVATGGSLQLSSLPVGEARLVVFHVDLAGNATPSEAVIAAVPAKTSGCSVAGPFVPMALLALMLARRRR